MPLELTTNIPEGAKIKQKIYHVNNIDGKNNTEVVTLIFEDGTSIQYPTAEHHPLENGNWIWDGEKFIPYI